MSLLNVFKFLSFADSITPLVETAKDAAYLIETGQTGYPISTGTPDIDKAKLKQAGIRVISMTRGWNESYIDVPDDQINEALIVLGKSI